MPSSLLFLLREWSGRNRKRKEERKRMEETERKEERKEGRGKKRNDPTWFFICTHIHMCAQIHMHTYREKCTYLKRTKILLPACCLSTVFTALLWLHTIKSQQFRLDAIIIFISRMIKRRQRHFKQTCPNLLVEGSISQPYVSKCTSLWNPLFCESEWSYNSHS